MANTTFTGPVRSENGFIGASKNATTGVYTNNFKVDASGVYTGTLMQPMGTVTTAKVNSSAGTNEVTFSQPAKTIITSIQLVCTSAPTVASGDIGYKVGTATGGAQLVTASTDEILDGGTTVAAGAHYSLTLLDTTASDASPAASPRVNTGTSARNIFLQITNTTTASDQGGFTWIVAYKQYA
mgnify:FL=1|jgi:hypothetical protein|tara:strand:+ start:23 stop:571 length:549 start_codon:yes stop_codon:yes gene_type:complete